jgi:hypothetical protein
MPKSLGRYSVAVKVFPNGINPANRTIQTIVMGLFGHTTRKSSLRNQNLTTFSSSGKKSISFTVQAILAPSGLESDLWVLI